MEDLIIRIAEKLFIIYFVSYFIIDLILFLTFLLTLNSERKKYQPFAEKERHKYKKVSVIVPAYNEEVSINECVSMLLQIDYPDYEIIIVNDGSTDKTLRVLCPTFEMQKYEREYYSYIVTKDIRGIYKAENRSIYIIDKENGGKADSINAGVNLASGEFICTIDADSILEKESLKKVVMPLLNNERVFVSGGQLAISNDTIIRKGVVKSSVLPRNIWVLWQITEYIKSFMVSRAGLSRINALLIMSGAFSVFRRKDLLEVKGYMTISNKLSFIKKPVREIHSTVCEDMEIVVRLWRYFHEKGIKGKAVFMPFPICWTEVPENYRNLSRQRSRWQMGLAEVLYIHKEMMFEPKYKETGLLAMPYYFFFELLSPLMKILSVLFIIVISIQGYINLYWIILVLVIVTFTTALITGIITVYLENWGIKQSKSSVEALRYKNFSDWLKLISANIAGDFSYSFLRVFAQLKGIYNFLRQDDRWNKFERKGIKNIETEYL